MRFAPGTLLRDTYEVVRLMGDEGTSAVYEVRHVERPGRYALKLLCEGGVRDPVLLDGFRREALAASALRHPGIVKVVDLDQASDGSPFIVMELLVGQDLGQLLRASRPLALSDVVAIVESIAAPLAAAHRHGILHGDLQPQDVFLLDAPPDPQTRVKVLDFGVARIRAQAGGVVRDAGPSPYQAPEQEQGRGWDVDARADVFGLGAIALAMLGGHAPPGILAVVTRATSPEREARFPGVTELGQALRDAVTATGVRVSSVRPARASTGSVPAVGRRPGTRGRPPARDLAKSAAAAAGLGLAVLIGAVVIPALTRAPRETPKVAAPAPSPAPTPPPAPAPVATTTPAPPAPRAEGPRRMLPSQPQASTERQRRRSAHADMSEADRREMEQSYQRATRAFDLGKYDDAIAAYKEAYRLGGDAPMLYNIAQALRLARQPEEAAVFYRRYLERAPQAPNREELRAMIAELTGGPLHLHPAPARDADTSPPDDRRD